MPTPAATRSGGARSNLLARRLRGETQEREFFTPADFFYDPETQTCRCPAGHSLYRGGVDLVAGGYRGSRFKAPKTACRSCPLRARCLRHPERTEQRQVAFLHERVAPTDGPIEAIKHKIDSLVGRRIYAKRLATVEPVFGNIQNKGMRRFTLRGKKKVSTQWKLFMLVHHIEKIATQAAG